jgi:uncharacterized protein YegP (UPF0339 family)
MKMGFWQKLFGKKSKGLGEDDGQAQYFKEDFQPVKKATKSEKATEAKKTESENKSNINVEPKKEEAVKKSASQKAEKEINENSPEVKSADKVKEGKQTKNGRFDIQKAKDGRFFFSLYSSNGAVVAYSQIYSSIGSVNTGIASVINNANKAEIEDTTLKKPVSLPCPKWEIYIDKAGEYRFRLYAINGLCVCHSAHGYSTKPGCKGGIESIRRYAEEATVDKSYLK